LVGVRRELIQALLLASDVGFTLFGDPAQGIYNFQAAEPLERQVGSLIFFDWVRKSLPGPPVEELTLTRNFRFQTDEARSAEWAGPLLNGAKPDYATIHEQLNEGLFDLEFVGALVNLVQELHAGGRHGAAAESTGILCRYNFEVLRVSAAL